MPDMGLANAWPPACFLFSHPSLTGWETLDHVREDNTAGFYIQVLINSILAFFSLVPRFLVYTSEQKQPKGTCSYPLVISLLPDRVLQAW